MEKSDKVILILGALLFCLVVGVNLVNNESEELDTADAYTTYTCNDENIKTTVNDDWRGHKWNIFHIGKCTGYEEKILLAYTPYYSVKSLELTEKNGLTKSFTSSTTIMLEKSWAQGISAAFGSFGASVSESTTLGIEQQFVYSNTVSSSTELRMTFEAPHGNDEGYGGVAIGVVAKYNEYDSSKTRGYAKWGWQCKWYGCTWKYLGKVHGAPQNYKTQIIKSSYYAAVYGNGKIQYSDGAR